MTGFVRKKRNDANGVSCVDKSPHKVTTTMVKKLRNQQKAHPWRRHQYIASDKHRGQCHLDNWPCIAASKAKRWRRVRPRVTQIYCGEYTTVSSKYVYAL